MRGSVFRKATCGIGLAETCAVQGRRRAQLCTCSVCVAYQKSQGNAALDIPSFTDRPFGCPPDIVIDIPVPPSVNRTRRVNWSARPLVEKWLKRADMLLMANGQYRTAKPLRIDGRYHLTITLDEKRCKIDPDNIAKSAIDYLRRIDLIENDSPKYARRIVIQWGTAPEGCRLTLSPSE